MGSKLWSVDMLLSELMIPMRNAYTRGDYPRACQLMHELIDFLGGMEQGFKEGEIPPKPKMRVLSNSFVRERQSNPRQYYDDCCQHYEDYSGKVMRRIGMCIKEVFKQLERMQFTMGP